MILTSEDAQKIKKKKKKTGKEMDTDVLLCMRPGAALLHTSTPEFHLRGGGATSTSLRTAPKRNAPTSVETIQEEKDGRSWNLQQFLDAKRKGLSRGLACYRELSEGKGECEFRGKKNKREGTRS